MNENIDTLVSAIDNSISDDERVELWNLYLEETDKSERTVHRTEDLDNYYQASEFGKVSDIVRTFHNLFDENGKPTGKYFYYDEKHIAQIFIPTVNIDSFSLATAINENRIDVENLPEVLQKILKN